ncbi:MAG: hypothetical protein HC918_13480 [Oscillatoriales cyanobacterium SM2_1_8]|nr:hypothetical protein [Oscillatoriales cyanobacterium SM2_1_8]
MSDGWISGAIALLSIALASIVAAEAIRDVYHWLGHAWQPLRPWHQVHHKVFRADLTPVSEAVYRRAEWVNDVPEALAMVSLTTLGALSLWYTWGVASAFVGSLYAGGFLVAAIARGWATANLPTFPTGPGP